MKIKRIVSSISASFDDLVSKVENHEAVADAVIGEVRQAAAKIQAQLNLAVHKRDKLLKEQAQLEEDCQRWKARAIACNETDKPRALQCVKALQSSENTLQHVQAQSRENLNIVNELQEHKSSVEQQLSALKIRRTSLSARQAHAKVITIMGETKAGTDADAVFMRWEERVIEDEYVDDVRASVSTNLDAEFREEEEQMALLSRLALLCPEPKSNDYEAK